MFTKIQAKNEKKKTKKEINEILCKPLVFHSFCFFVMQWEMRNGIRSMNINIYNAALLSQHKRWFVSHFESFYGALFSTLQFESNSSILFHDRQRERENVTAAILILQC